MKFDILKNLQLSLTMTHLGIFFLSEHFLEEVIQNFQRKIIALNKNDQTYEAKKEYYKNAMEEDLMLLNLLKRIKGKEEKISKNK